MRESHVRRRVGGSYHPEPSELRLSRRQVLVAGGTGIAATALTACAGQTAPLLRPVGAGGPEVEAAERARQVAGATTASFTVNPGLATVDLGGVTVDTWAYDGVVPGPLLTADVGQTLEVTVANSLPDPTSVHWHGLALRNDMDGVPGLTQSPIAARESMTYRFSLAHPGTYWFHPHVGTQLDRGLYAPLIINDPSEPGAYDAEHVIVLDDWLDGTGENPDQVLDRLRSEGMDMGGMGGSPASEELGGDAGDVVYPYYLVNGRIGTAPQIIDALPGQRLRLRLINAGSDTAFRVALGDHHLTVTHTDGFPVQPFTGDAVLIGMGERVDVLVTVGDGVFPLVSLAEGKDGGGLALIRTGAGAAPDPDIRPLELVGRVVTVRDLRATDDVLLPERRPDRTHDLVLEGGMDGYQWTINGRTFDRAEFLQIRAGENVRLRFVNRSMMFHPMHVHGHTFQVRNSDGDGPRKDTVIVRPMETVVADLVADNPGQWLTHCHNIYHGEAGMMTTLSYVL